MGKRRVLVIDDSITSVMALREALGDAYEVRAALNFAVVAGEVLRHVPDVVVLDLHMPAMGGEQMAPRIRALGCSAPIVLYTGSDALAAVRAKDAIGAVGIITKGCSPDEARRTIWLAGLLSSRVLKMPPRRRQSSPRLAVG